MWGTLGASLVDQLVKNLPAVRETCVRSLGWEDPLEKGTAMQHSGLENSMDCIVHGVLQARILEQIAIPLARGSSQPRDLTQVSHIGDRFLTSCATGEELGLQEGIYDKRGYI